MKFNFKKIVKILNPPPRIGGLEVSDSSLHLVFINEETKQIQQAALSLRPGIVRDGRVVEEKNLIAALKELRLQARWIKGSLPVIVSLSSANVYNQVFNLPLLEDKQLEEAARLNLQMISPIKREKSYSDWQLLGETTTGTHEVLGSFIDANIIDEFSNALRTAGFMVVAIEFVSLSLTRFLRQFPNLDLTKPYVILNLGGEGINFLVIYKGDLYFDHFLSWRIVQEKSDSQNQQVTFEIFQKSVTTELRKLLNFYGNRWEGGLNNLVLISAGPGKEITEWLQKDFGLITTSIDKYENFDTIWFPAIGAALRGLVSRAEDKFISLANVGTEEEFSRSRIWRFIRLWRNAAFVFLGCIVLLYVASDLLLINMNGNLKEQLRRTRISVDQQQIIDLKNEATTFNDLVKKVQTAKGQAMGWSQLFSKVYGFAGKNITINQMNFDPASGTVSIAGSASNEQIILAFKNFLLNEPNFTNVSLPLAAITSTTGGASLFNASFRVKK